MAQSPEPERMALQRMLADASWPRRALAIMRLERFDCAESESILCGLLGDPQWQVRVFATRGLKRRGVTGAASWFATESEPRVIRAALRHGYPIDLERLSRGVRLLSRSNDLADKLLAAELASASGDPALVEDGTESAKQVILRMGRAEAGAFSARLGVMVGRDDLHRPLEWQQWLLKTGRRFELQSGARKPERHSPADSVLGTLDSEAFVGLESYMEELRQRKLDLAICLDCTASMYGELAEAQGGIDDLMRFVGDVSADVRVAIVGYRDRREEFEIRAWDFTDDIDQARGQIWSLSADGGGDNPESVLDALTTACTKLTWRPEAAKVMVLIGDAPPHVGEGGLCVRLAERAQAQVELVTHVIEAEGKPVKHFAEIAQAGGGRCVALTDDGLLVGEIAGLSLGDRYQEEFQEFFRVYLELCR